MRDSHEKYSPVVAVDIDGVLRVDPPDPGAPPGEGVYRRRVTVRRDGYPTFKHREPDWDTRGRWISTHRFSGIGADWVRSLLDRSITVVFATTWQEAANRHLTRPLGLPALPVATTGSGPDYWTASFWKAMTMGPQFPGRPLLWVDDQVGADALQIIEDDRRPLHSSLTHWHCVRGDAGITPDDVAELNHWLALATTCDGQRELRRERDRLDQRRQLVTLERTGVARDDRWNAIHARLLRVLGPDQIITEILADLAIASPNHVEATEVDKVVAWRGPAHTPPTEVLLELMRIVLPEDLEQARKRP